VRNIYFLSKSLTKILPKQTTFNLKEYIKPYPAKEMSSHPVGKIVIIPETDSTELLTPLNSFVNLFLSRYRYDNK